MKSISTVGQYGLTAIALADALYNSSADKDFKQATIPAKTASVLHPVGSARTETESRNRGI